MRHCPLLRSHRPHGITRNKSTTDPPSFAIFRTQHTHMFRTLTRLPPPPSPHSPISKFCTSSTTRLNFLPHKVKQEMALLHAEDAKRWNASTLAVRYAAPRENVETWLRLCKLRVGKEKRDNEDTTRMREEVVDAWGKLRESDEKRKMIMAEPRQTIENSGPAPSEGDDGGMEGGVEEKAEVVEVEIRKSRTAEWVERVCEMGVRDVKRKTTFVFVEVGEEVTEGVQGAVWIREASTGKLRVALEKERQVLLGMSRSQDPSVWE